MVFILGFGYDKEVIERLLKLTGIQATTMVTSVVKAWKRVGARRISVGTACTPNLNDLPRTFLEDCGFEITTMEGLGLLRNVDMGDPLEDDLGVPVTSSSQAT